MIEPIVAVSLIVGVSALLSLSLRVLLDGRFVIALCTAVTTSMGFQIVNYFHLGYLDPFFPIALVFVSMISFPTALLIGAAYASSHDKSQQSEQGEPDQRAAAPEAEAGGGEKPKPESEGRSE